MVDRFTEWLGAYHDGELGRARLRQLEQHLAGCAACQAELAEIRKLSATLHEPPLGDEFLPAESFATQLALRMPRQTAPSQPLSAGKIGWWLAPFALLGAWLFLDIALALTSAAALVVETGLLNGSLAWMQPETFQMGWFVTVMDWFGSNLSAPGQQALAALHSASLWLSQAAGRLLLEAILGLAYLGWLAGWWLRSQSGGHARIGA
jgi:anti-sigma factor RsiW